MCTAGKAIGCVVIGIDSHTLNSSQGKKWLVLGLVWLSAHLARQFLRRVQELMDIPENVGLSGPAKIRGLGVKKVKETEKRGRRRKTDKLEISSPCGFQHHVSLSLEEWTKMTGLQ